MTKIEEIEQEIEELKKEYWIKVNELMKLKESKKKGKWKPTLNQEYWFRSASGSLEVSNWEDDELDNGRYNNITLFPTKEECERYWHFMDTVKEKSYEFTELDWKNDEIKKYTIYYNFLDGKFNTTNISDSKFLGEIYFKSKEDAKYIIDNFKEELLEYWL